MCEGVVVKEEGGGVGGAYPFCSARCRLVDLGKWMKEEYVISRAVEESDIEEGD
ncbi:MAG: DNA gyrase inhibitor YacG [Planctomycetota bacterium]|nr:DNA gyrase inhibitor YacG [Planctomycetota bacterium]